jgi:hypothetical protein
MAENNKPSRVIYQISSKPGFSRDGTVLDRSTYVDGQWTRFQRARPKKMGGYKEVSSNIEDKIRGSFVYSKGQLEYLYGFGSNKSWLSTTNSAGASSIATLSTFPDLPVADDYTFQADAIFDSTGGNLQKLLVHPASNIADIASTIDTNIYIATVGSNPVSYSKVLDGEGGEVTVSGGVVVLQPYVFAYGNDGLIKNSNPNQPNNWVIAPGNDANEVNVAGTKIVKGLPYRAGSNSPAGLFWSLDSFIRVSRTGSDFRYDTLSAQTTILAPNSAIEYDGIYYWIGVDRFQYFNGTVNELPNTQNYNWFFDNVNYSQRAKIWSYKNTRYGEIWWFFPFGLAEECTHAIIYNVRENIWYDCAISRSNGYSSRVFRFPVLFGNEQNMFGNYSNFIHEFGMDAIQGGEQLAIPSYFETSDFGYPTGGADSEKPTGNDYWTRIIRVEPDFLQVGNMSMIIKGEEFARSNTTESIVYTFGPTDGKIDTRGQWRQIRLRFESNLSGGNFEMGRVILHLERGDIRS